MLEDTRAQIPLVWQTSALFRQIHEDEAEYFRLPPTNQKQHELSETTSSACRHENTLS